MSEYMQEDLERAQRLAFDICDCTCVDAHDTRRNQCPTNYLVPRIVTEFSAVRAEARQAPNLSERECQVCGEKLPKASSFSVHNGKCRRTGSRLAAAEKLVQALDACMPTIEMEWGTESDTYQAGRAALAEWEAAK